MIPFDYRRPASNEDALKSIAPAGAMFLGGGTNLIDLMKLNVERPSTLIDITKLELTRIELLPDGGLRVGALVRNSDLANHPRVISDYPLLSQALLSGASPQLRNMATAGGNLLQRTRCYYFTDTAFPACNKRVPGSGCAAIQGFNRVHAILGQSDQGPESPRSCIATNPSDMNVALAALDATVQVESLAGKRSIPISEFHRLPGTTPNLDTNLKHGELVTSIELSPAFISKNSCYLKIRDRQSYAFALVSVAAGLEMEQERIQSARLALGGVAHKPWRSLDAEKALIGAVATPDSFARAADILLQGAKAYEHNAFKIQLAKRGIVRALTIAAHGTTSGVNV